MDVISSKVSDLLAPKNEEVNKRGDLASRDEFLHLLVTQLKYQDPLNPASPEDFSAQLAQFSALEQLMNINTTLTNSQNSDIVLTQAINNSLICQFHPLYIKASFYYFSLKSS